MADYFFKTYITGGKEYFLYGDGIKLTKRLSISGRPFGDALLGYLEG